LHEISLTLRPVTNDDAELLYRVYASTRDDVLAAPLSDSQLQEFLRMQCAAQQRDYEARFPNATHSIVVADGADVGRIWIDRRPDEIRLLDVTLLPEHRNVGLGAELLGRLIAESLDEEKPLRHSVYKENVSAMRLYHRLGFGVIEDFEVYVLMEWIGTTRDAT
jgi:ribosomal protein S18 acetylase RimI-like enzyme